VHSNTVPYCEMENYQKVSEITETVQNKSRIGFEEKKER
jgi:hypothetical protein